MLNMFGSLLKSDSNFTGSGDSSTSESNFIVSLTLPAVLPQPLSNPHSLNLQTAIEFSNEVNWHLKNIRLNFLNLLSNLVMHSYSLIPKWRNEEKELDVDLSSNLWYGVSLCSADT